MDSTARASGSARGQGDVVKVDIRAADRTEVFRRLHNGAMNCGPDFPITLAALQAQLPAMTVEQAQVVMAARGKDLYFDYVNGRSMKVDLGGDVVDLWLYDRDCGRGAGRRALEGLEGVVFLEES